MRVCFISEAKSCHTQRWTRGLAQAGLDVHLISDYKADISGVELHHVPIYSPNPLEQMVNNIRIKRLLRELDAEVIHFFGLFSVSSLGTMFLARNMKNMVISVWGSDVVPGGNKDSFKQRIIKRYLLNRGDCLVATSRYLAKEVQRHLKQPRSIEVVPWGVDLDVFQPADRKGGSEVVKVGFAKRLHPLSGPDILLKAFKYAHSKSDRQLILKIAGNGPMESRLKQKAAEMGLADSIEWMGWLKTAEELRDFYRSIDIFVMPSRRESFGVSAVEASATGLPVIASRFGGIPEIVIHGETGLLVAPEDIEELGNAILILAKNIALRKNMGLKGRENVAGKFDWKMSIAKMIEIYRRISMI